MSEEKREKQVFMSKAVAHRWLKKEASAYYQVTIFTQQKHPRIIANLLRSSRDDKLRVNNMEPIKDLGVKESFDGVTLWSRNQDKLTKLATWFESKGYDTTGVF